MAKLVTLPKLHFPGKMVGELVEYFDESSPESKTLKIIREEGEFFILMYIG